MDLEHVVQRCWPWRSSQSVAEIDAEIREELEFHLHMRTRDNLRSGMSPEEAGRDAQQRFGDFEANRRACRKITLGPRLLLGRMQSALLVGLVAVVVYQGVLILRLQTTSREQIEALTQVVEQLRVAREPVRDEAAVIPFMAWDRDQPGTVVADDGNSDALASWNTTEHPLQRPWSDWDSIDVRSAAD